jgi:hypothetical protein
MNKGKDGDSREEELYYYTHKVYIYNNTLCTNEGAISDGIALIQVYLRMLLGL